MSNPGMRVELRESRKVAGNSDGEVGSYSSVSKCSIDEGRGGNLKKRISRVYRSFAHKYMEEAASDAADGA